MENTLLLLLDIEFCQEKNVNINCKIISRVIYPNILNPTMHNNKSK